MELIHLGPGDWLEVSLPVPGGTPQYVHCTLRPAGQGKLEVRRESVSAVVVARGPRTLGHALGEVAA